MGHTPDYEIISARTCPYVQRVTIALTEKHVPFKHTTIDLKDKPDWFLRLSPFGKVPLLKIPGDRVLFESQVINEYLDDVGSHHLHPADPFLKGQNRAWIVLISSIIMSFGGYYYAKELATVNDRIETVQGKLARLEEVLGDGPFFNGADFSLVDAAAAPLFARMDLLNQYHPINLLAPFPKVSEWSTALLQRDSVRSVVTAQFQNDCLQALKNKGVYIAQYLHA